jgi:Hydroxymethylglutaryl-coenzyme A reductase
MFLRFNFTTGDAAGQNLSGKATSQACNWIRAHYPGVRHFCLESNLATDKKSSQVRRDRRRDRPVRRDLPGLGGGRGGMGRRAPAARPEPAVAISRRGREGRALLPTRPDG